MDRFLRHTLNGHGGSVNIQITEEQAEKLGPPKKISQFNIGFLPSERVPSYHCNKCACDYTHSPEIEVYVRGMIGENPTTTVRYVCSECSKQIHFEFIESPAGIDTSYIVFDELGDWKTPSVEDIEAMFSKAKASAEAGEGGRLDGGRYHAHLRQALHWASKISYEIPKDRIAELETTYRASYLTNMRNNLPALVREIKGRSHGFDNRVDESGISNFEGTGLYEVFEPFYEALPFIEIDDVELRQDVLRILYAYKGMSATALDELEKERRKLDEQIAAERRDMEVIANRITAFEELSGLTREEIETVRQIPLSTFPGDYDDL